tara:strand:+ start:53 stop:298 length:246 start_codon:yes stop_codon:yes gene_type:complete
MPKSRKTLEVTQILEWANTQLTRTDSYSQKEGFKAGISHMIENILFMTNNYNGYMYNDDNSTILTAIGDYDRTYYTHNNLK